MAEDTAQAANWAAQLRANQMSEAKRREELRLTQERRAAAAKGAQSKAQAFSWKQSGGIGLMDTRPSTPPPTPSSTVSRPVSNEQLARQQLLARQSAAQAQARQQQQMIIQSQMQAQDQEAALAGLADKKKKKEAKESKMADISSIFQLGDKATGATCADGGSATGPIDLTIFSLRFIKTYVVESFEGIFPFIDRFFPEYKMGIKKPMDMANMWASGGTIALVFSMMLFIILIVGLVGWALTNPIEARHLLGPAIMSAISGAPAVITN